MSGTLDIVRPAAGAGIMCLSFSGITRRGSLVGFADLHIPAYRMRLFSCTVHAQNGRRWIGLPGRPWVNRDNELIRDETTGKIRYQVVVAFDSKDILDRFSDSAVAAVEAYYPRAFG